eukprot:6080270-Pyramimonas_sp.AAC.1
MQGYPWEGCPSVLCGLTVMGSPGLSKIFFLATRRLDSTVAHVGHQWVQVVGPQGQGYSAQTFQEGLKITPGPRHRNSCRDFRQPTKGHRSGGLSIGTLEGQGGSRAFHLDRPARPSERPPTR